MTRNIVFILGLFLSFSGQSNGQVISPEMTSFIMDVGNSLNEDGSVNMVRMLCESESLSDLEMTPEQREAVKEEILRVGLTNFAASNLLAKVQGPSKQMLERYQSGVRSRAINLESEFHTVLLPHQVAQLKEMAFNAHFQTTGISGLFSSPVGAMIGLTDEEIKRINSKAKLIEKNLKKQIEELTQAAKMELLNEIPEEKRQTLKHIYGVDLGDNNN